MANTQTLQIYDQLLSLILDGNFEVGDKFPTEMELAKKFNVARSTIREVISMLNAKGFLEARRGSGTYVKCTSIQTDQNTLIIDRIENLDDFMEIRSTIETLGTRLFIKRYSNEKLEHLISVEKSFEKAVKDKNVDKMALYDESFHRTIIEGSDNALLMNIGEVLASSFRSYRIKTFSNESHRQYAVDSHKRIVDALKRKDTSDAIYNMREHLNTSLINAQKKK